MLTPRLLRNINIAHPIIDGPKKQSITTTILGNEIHQTPKQTARKRGYDKLAMLESANKDAQLDVNKHQSLFNIHRESTNLVASSLAAQQRNSVNTQNRLSRGLKRPSSKFDHLRGSQGKFVMIPSIRQLARVKNSILMTEDMKGEFLRRLQAANQEQQVQQQQIVTQDQNRQNESVTNPETQFLNNNNTAMDPGRKNQAKHVNQDIQKSKLSQPIKLGNYHQVGLIQEPKMSDSMHQKNNEMVENFKTHLQYKQSLKKSHVKSKKLTYNLEEIKLDPNQAETPTERSKSFHFNARPKEGLFIYATKIIKDHDLFDFLLTLADEKIAKFSITNAQLTDAGITILSEFFSLKSNLTVLKLYNNIMVTILNNTELPFMFKGTASLAKCLGQNQRLVTLELHGFFFHEPDFPLIVDALYECSNLKKLQLSNNNVQDSGVEQICRLFNYQETQIKLQQLTIYNNNITDAGAIQIAQTMKGNRHLQILNLQLNFIKDRGGYAFVENINNNEYHSIQKIILIDNECTEDFKKKVKKIDIIAI